MYIQIPVFFLVVKFVVIYNIKIKTTNIFTLSCIKAIKLIETIINNNNNRNLYNLYI